MDSKTEVAIRFPGWSVQSWLSLFSFHPAVSLNKQVQKGEIIGRLQSTEMWSSDLISPISGTISYINTSVHYKTEELIVRIKSEELASKSTVIADNTFQHVMSKCNERYKVCDRSLNDSKKQLRIALLSWPLTWFFCFLMLANVKEIHSLFLTILIILFSVLLFIAPILYYRIEREKKKGIEQEIARFPGKSTQTSDCQKSVSLIQQ